MPREHRYRRRVQFAETDMAGMVHFSWYFRYMEEAEHALWRAAGLSIAAPDDPLRYPRVEASCAFRAPLRFEDEFDVTIGVAAIGSRSIRYTSVMTRGDTTIATGTMTIACIDTTRGAPPSAIEIPPSVAAALCD